MPLSPDDRLLLARLVDAEAADQPILGRIAVAAVVLNRRSLPGYGGPTIRGVIYAKDQFECTANGRLDAVQSPQHSTYHAVAVAEAGFDPTEGCTFYWAYKLADPSNWVVQNTRARLVIADHLFAVARSGT